MKYVGIILTLLVALPSQSQENSRLKGWRKTLYGSAKVYEYKKTIDEIEEPFSISQNSFKNPQYKNEMRILHNGLGALVSRLDMIKKARRTIEMEYFMFLPRDISSKIIIHELINAANRGVKVRILVDKSKAIFEFKPEYVFYIKDQIKKKYQKNFEVRYYNAAPLIQVSTMNFRDHRKLTVIDDQEMITGGRNIENMYFDLNKEFNYSDRDVWVKGTIVPKVRLSFEEYWKHKISERITDRDHYPGDEDYERAKSELTMSGADYGDYQRIMIVGRRNMEQMPIRECPITSYATDLPGATFRDRIKSNYKEKFRITERAFGKRLRMSKKVHISSPYFMMNTRSGKMMDDLYAKGVDMTILTNSLGATDATYVSAAFYRVMHDWADIGVQSYLHNSKFYNHGRYGIVYPEVMNARWGLHSKTQVYYYEDGTSGFMIGTYNIDNRSSFYNNEMAMFCDGSDELTADLQKDIDERMIYNGYKVIEKDLAEDHQGNRSREYYYGHAPEKKIRLMKNISIPVEVLQFLL